MQQISARCPSLALAILIIGGIYSGAFTPTEAAAVGFAVAMIISVIGTAQPQLAGFQFCCV